MAYIMGKAEKAALIERFDFVRDAKDELWVGGINGHMSSTAQFTKNGWRKHFMKCDYIMTSFGIPVEVDRPSIKSTVYYDDEYSDPMGGGEDSKKRVWMDYNLRYDAPNSILYHYGERIELWHLMLDKPFIYDCKNQGVLGTFQALNEFSDYQGFYKQEMRLYMDESEVIEYCECLDKLTEAYKKRLESYWKRYRDKIWSSGYWANR